jgi:hypothetical protein
LVRLEVHPFQDDGIIELDGEVLHGEHASAQAVTSNPILRAARFAYMIWK